MPTTARKGRRWVNKRLGTFEQFSDDICAPLVWLGMPDPVDGVSRADADEGVAGLADLLSVWQWEILNNEVTTKEALAYDGVKEYFREEFEDKGEVNVCKVGRLIAKYAGRVINGLRIVQSGVSHNAVTWKLENVS